MTTQELKDRWYKIRIEESKKARTGTGGAVCVDDEFESAVRFANEFYQSKIDAVTKEVSKEADRRYPIESEGFLSYNSSANEGFTECFNWLKEKLKQ